MERGKRKYKRERKGEIQSEEKKEPEKGRD